MRLELMTFCLQGKRSTAELKEQKKTKKNTKNINSKNQSYIQYISYNILLCAFFIKYN